MDSTEIIRHRMLKLLQGRLFSHRMLLFLPVFAKDVLLYLCNLYRQENGHGFGPAGEG